jgi:protein TonB
LEPCFRTSFKGQVPPDARSVRFEVRWVVSRGSDTERPTAFPSLVRAKAVPGTPKSAAAAPPPAPPAPKRKRGVVAAKAQANLASYFTDDDYPAEAIRQEQQGTAAFQLSIDRAGKVTACEITRTSGSTILDQTTCRIMLERPRFEPARDRRGRAIEDKATGRIMWKLPEPENEFRMKMPERQTITYRILRDGSLADCKGESVDGGKVVLSSNEADCPSRAPPAAIMTAIRSQSEVAEPRVRSEMRLLRQASEPWPQFKEPGQKVLSRVDARLTVEADGRVSGCTVLEMTSLIGPAPSPCNATGLLALIPRDLSLPGEVRVVTAVLLEGEPAPAK